jgi:hypothetical protein
VEVSRGVQAGSAAFVMGYPSSAAGDGRAKPGASSHLVDKTAFCDETLLQLRIRPFRTAFITFSTPVAWKLRNVRVATAVFRLLITVSFINGYFRRRVPTQKPNWGRQLPVHFHRLKIGR